MSCDSKKDTDFKVFQFNIWQEGTVVDGGFEAIVDEIVRSDADFVTLSEVRNYNGSRFCDRIVEALKQRGKAYYSFYSYDTGLLSLYPIIDSAAIFPPQNDEGSIYKLVAKVNNHLVSVYTAHLDYRHCAYYDVFGYNGTTWAKQEPVTDVDSILVLNRMSKRDDAIRLFLKDAEADRAKGHLILLGGDFNEPSHLDWTEAAKNMFNHNGLVVPWDLSVMLTDAGYVDSYRELYPNPLTHPGVTFPADNPDKDISALTWAPESDERERIDFIYYYPDKCLKAKSAVVVGPSGSIAYSKRIESDSQDEFILPLGVWPTDHKGVLTTFVLK